jgi:ATP-dependent Clp protease ATP-binding subunit ClpC
MYRDYAGKADTRDKMGGLRMFERFTDRARRVVVLAQEEARTLNHDYIGTEHILLALIRESGGIAAQALESLGITEEAARQQVEEIIGRGQQDPPRGHIPFTPRAKKALQLSMREAIALGHATSGPSTSCSASSARTTVPSTPRTSRTRPCFATENSTCSQVSRSPTGVGSPPVPKR